MLLNKRLTTFLSQNTSSQLPTLLLLSPTGKLLTSSSPLPATALRSQATIACSLWTLYQNTTSSSVSNSLPQTSAKTTPASDSTVSSTSTTTATEHELNTITLQLTNGVMVIRQLSCGLLFVAIGSSPSVSSPRPNTYTMPSGTSSHATPLGSPPAANGDEHIEGSQLMGMGSAAASDAGSLRSVGGTKIGIMGLRRQADEVGKWLDGQLEGFALSSSEGR